MANTKRGKYTFDTIHRDSFPRQFLVRLANDSDGIEDTFESLKDIRESLGAIMSQDIFYSKEVVDDLLTL